MSFNSRKKGNVLPLATTGFTGAAPQTVGAVAANKIVMAKPNFTPAAGTLCVEVTAKATTNTLTISAKWQVSDDGSTWVDAYGPNRPANVAIVTGTGSAVTDTVRIAAPDSVYAANYVRAVAYSGVGVGGGAGVDEASLKYHYIAERGL